ncbi:MAG TPA: serine/threonine-protein kinase [Longimicrobiales bacterium]|nr:serine/threonine-protein kinase [Longimicrobiales bacterium]
MITPPDDLTAALGGDYEFVRTLGSGNAATVYLAKDRALGVLVAIKALNPSRSQEETARKRFEREARSAASLADHPNIVAVSRFGVAEGRTPYVIMQYVKGRTMEERLKAEGRLPMAEARRVLADVASALSVAHEKGIVHRDVRLGNVLWDEEKERALLTDFGIAAVMDPSGMQASRLTSTGQMLADPKYQTPEQLQDHAVTQLSDVYLFGVLGYELLTGEGPYDARSNTEWINAHLRMDPRDLRAFRPDADPALADLLRRCLAREPQHRPSVKDIIRVLKGDEGAGGASAAVDDLEELVRRRVPQIVIITAGAGITLIGLADALEEMLPPDAKLLAVIFAVAAVLASGVVGWFHGEKGKQRAPTVEWALLGLVAAAWLIVSWFAVAR